MTRGLRVGDCPEQVVLPPPAALRVAPFSFGTKSLWVLSYPLTPNLPACLSDVEAAVVLLAQKGFSNVEIARIRAASVRTVANQLASAYRKLGGASRSRLHERSAHARTERVLQ